MAVANEWAALVHDAVVDHEGLEADHGVARGEAAVHRGIERNDAVGVGAALAALHNDGCLLPSA